MTVNASSTARTAFSGIPNQFFVAPGLALEIARGQRPFGADPLQDALGHRGVVCEGRRVEPPALAAPVRTEPGELARRDERQRLVRRLEDVAALVELVAPGRLVAGDACVQHEIVIPAGDRDRVELDRPELPEDREDRVRAALERARRREELPGDEKAARVLFADLHRADATATEGPSRQALSR